MKKKVKEIASMLFALCLSACLLAGCAGDGEVVESSSEIKTETEITASAEDNQEDSQKEESETEETSSSNPGSPSSQAASSEIKSQGSGSGGSTAQSSKPPAAKPSAGSGNAGNSSSVSKPGNSGSQSSRPSTGKPSASSSSGNSGSASKPSTGNSGSTSTPAPTPPAQESKPSEPSEPAHTHTWVWATHTETIPEQFHIVQTKKYVCNNCGAQFDNAHDVGTHVAADFWDDCENYTYKVVDSQKVVDVPEQTVTVNDYEYCSECGARK